MEITHVIRGEEWLPSTPKHVLLYQAFGWEIPTFAHLPLLLNPDKSKLSKRQGDVAVEDYLKKGYLKEALVNFVVLLGWNPGAGSTQEIFSLEELIVQFDLTHVHKGGAVFDHQKLDWMNSEYIKALSIDDLYDRMVSGEFFERNFIKDAPAVMQSAEHLRRVLVVEQERLATLAQFGEVNPFFWTASVTCTKDTLRWKANTDQETNASLGQAKIFLTNAPDAIWETREILMEHLLQAASDQRGDFLWPLRVALSGAEKSPSPADIAWVVGKDVTLNRIDQALELFSEI
jgi:glutamyl/glutaminyl-tRNA synthetase